jgi:acetyl-CoA carboxylase, biotin carboxylase subunit
MVQPIAVDAPGRPAGVVPHRPVRRVLVANRGEIAVRIVRACQQLGIEAVAAVSEADVGSLAARMAGHHVLIGPAPAAQSYLLSDRLVAAALASHCDAVHPGYGFLSERAAFAQDCEAAGLVFIGPSPQAIAAMGDKISAASLAAAAGVPRVPGTGAMPDADTALVHATRIGFPVLVKAAAGGGGRGMRIVRTPQEMPTAFASAQAEAAAAFGDGTLYVEKLIEHARHIEIQLLGDRHGHVVHLGERECSTQRRHQKLIEESPSPALNAETRARMAACAVALARSVGYFSAGTVEFVLDDADGNFYFLEMNTRIQVEHPVTEMVTGIDLVAEQIRIAGGAPLALQQADVVLQGHAIECRINAEDPDRNFLPRPGLVRQWTAPEGDGVRCDTHCTTGTTITPHYDSLLAKLIVHAPTRVQAIDKMRRALSDLQVEGPSTTAAFHRDVLGHADFQAGRVTTRWVEQIFMPARQAERKAQMAAEATKALTTLKETP